MTTPPWEAVPGPTWPGIALSKNVGEQQVWWFETCLFMERVLLKADCGPLPWPGTSVWRSMPDDDPRKLLALGCFGVHHALRVDIAQQALADASSAISAGQDWSEVARSRLRHGNTGRNARGGKTPPSHRPFRPPIKEPSR